MGTCEEPEPAHPSESNNDVLLETKSSDFNEHSPKYYMWLCCRRVHIHEMTCTMASFLIGAMIPTLVRGIIYGEMSTIAISIIYFAASIGVLLAVDYKVAWPLKAFTLWAFLGVVVAFVLAVPHFVQSFNHTSDVLSYSSRDLFYKQYNWVDRGRLRGLGIFYSVILLIQFWVFSVSRKCLEYLRDLQAEKNKQESYGAV